MKIPKPIRIIDTVIHPIRFRDVICFIDESIKTHRHAILLPMNIHILVELSKNPKLKKAHETADVVFCDGVPLVWFSRLAHQPLPERISGTDLAESLLQGPYRIFLLGSTPEVLAGLKKKYSSICGTFSPPFKNEWGKDETRQIIQKINTSKPDVLLVALGPLKQEQWILKNFPAIRVPIALAVGSALDILSGKIPRAPKWMQNSGLEWAWRIALEPKRLTRRYLNDCKYLIYGLNNK
jgi:N-acetylglucosaminyldiphosphoundecaprenol N-acetyl-beta-D-mannosaminyltransferase